MANAKTCYIISQIGEPDSEERKWANFVRENIIKLAVIDCGYTEPARADDPDTSTDLIMMDIQKTRDSHLLMAGVSTQKR